MSFPDPSDVYMNAVDAYETIGEEESLLTKHKFGQCDLCGKEEISFVIVTHPITGETYIVCDDYAEWLKEEIENEPNCLIYKKVEDEELPF